MTAKERYVAYLARKKNPAPKHRRVTGKRLAYTKHRFTDQRLADIRHYVENYGNCTCEVCTTMPPLKLPRNKLCSSDVQVLYGYSKQGITKAINEKRLNVERIPGMFTLITLDEMERYIREMLRNKQETLARNIKRLTSTASVLE